MIKHLKLLTFLTLLVFILPIATAFCCCTDTDPNLSRQALLSHYHHTDSHDNYNHHNHHQHKDSNKESSSESCECGSEIIGNLTKPVVDFSLTNASLSKLHVQSLVFTYEASVFEYYQWLPYYDTGPPGSRFISNPSYLESLRI